MIIPDVNILVHAWWAESTEHERARAWLENAASTSDVLGISELVLSGVARVLTHPKITRGAFASADVLELADELLAARGVSRIRPGPMHWPIFRRLCASLNAAGNQIRDCNHAALAMEQQALWISADRFFERIDGLHWQRPW